MTYSIKSDIESKLNQNSHTNKLADTIYTSFGDTQPPLKEVTNHIKNNKSNTNIQENLNDALF